MGEQRPEQTIGVEIHDQGKTIDPAIMAAVQAAVAAAMAGGESLNVRVEEPNPGKPVQVFHGMRVLGENEKVPKNAALVIPLEGKTKDAVALALERTGQMDAAARLRGEVWDPKLWKNKWHGFMETTITVKRGLYIVVAGVLVFVAWEALASAVDAPRLGLFSSRDRGGRRAA